MPRWARLVCETDGSSLIVVPAPWPVTTKASLLKPLGLAKVRVREPAVSSSVRTPWANWWPVMAERGTLVRSIVSERVNDSILARKLWGSPSASVSAAPENLIPSPAATLPFMVRTTWESAMSPEPVMGPSMVRFVAGDDSAIIGVDVLRVRLIFVDGEDVA